MNINQIKTRLLLSTALALVAVTAPAAAQAQTAAQDTQKAALPPAEQVESVVVTGSSIRGVQPVGSDLITVGRDSIEQTSVQTVQQLLKTVPAITGMQNAGQGAYGSQDAAGTYAPTIHGLGGVSSNSTLVLVDGHRIPLSGILRSLGDPNLIPTNALQRVEVLPDGSSSVYGSDAVAGVVNFITRSGFDGLELTGQKGFADSYNTASLGVIGGRVWNTGSALFAYEYSNRSSLLQAARNFDLANQIPRGGNTNNGNFACSPATITIGANFYQYPYNSPGTSTAQVNAPCNQNSVTDLLPSDVRHSAMIKVQEQVTDRLTIDTDVVYSRRLGSLKQSAGTVSATIFGPGNANAAQINPFFVLPAGVAATSETVKFNGDGLLGTQAYNKSTVESMYANAKAEYKLSDTWQLTSFFMAGVATTRQNTFGALCVSCANLALNGTTNSSGSTTTPPVSGAPGTGLTLLNTPLTAANALDPFNPLATNRTSPAVLAQLATNPNLFKQNRQEILQYNIKLDGTLFTLPAGDVKVAVGGEYVNTPTHATGNNNLNLGSTGASQVVAFNYVRDVKSAYGEILIPVISEGMNIPLVRRFDLNVSGRYDYYNVFGATTNPKFAANWEVVDGLKVRANIASSFVAPPVGTVGTNGQSLDTDFQQEFFTFSVPLANYPTLKQVPACAAQTTNCTIGIASGVQGMLIEGANPTLKQQTGRTWSVGADYTPTFLDGLVASFTFWHNKLLNGVTAPSPQSAVNSTAFLSLLQIFPTGATAAQIAAFQGNRPQVSVLPNPVFFGYNFSNQNALNLTAEGIDASIRYRTGFDWGYVGAGIATSFMTRFDEALGAGSPVFSVLDRSGFNNTFPSNPPTVRADLDITYDKISAALFVNYSGGYTWWGSPVHPITSSASGVPNGGGDHVNSFTTIDVNLAYDLGNILPGNTSLFVDVTNLFDQDPPFVNNYNSTLGFGYDQAQASPIGRVVTIGFRAKL